jgi:surfactin synthase thioesterase subunit
LHPCRADIQAEETYKLYTAPNKGKKNVIRANSTWAKAQKYKQLHRDIVLDGPIIMCPITVFTGVLDEHTCEPGLQDWKQFCTGPMQVVRMNGDHFFLEDAKNRDELIRSIGHTLVNHLSNHSNWITTDRSRGGKT